MPERGGHPAAQMNEWRHCVTVAHLDGCNPQDVHEEWGPPQLAGII